MTLAGKSLAAGADTGLRRALLAVAAALLLAACSSVTRVAYNNAVFAATWLVDDWFALQDGQRDWVKERFAKLHAWHRASELPDYERLLQDTGARAATRLTQGDVRHVYAEMRVLYRRTVRRAIPDMADFLLQVRPEQVDYLERKFAEDNERLARETLMGMPQERSERRAKRFIERIDDFTGSLSGAQRDLVRARVQAMEDITGEWMRDRRIRQAEILALVRARPAREAMIEGLTRILLDTGSWRRPEYQARLEARNEQVFAMIAALDATFTPRQRAKLHRTLASYAADVAYLMVAS